MLAIFNREVNAYFSTFIGYVFMGMFVFATALFFTLYNIIPASANFLNVFSGLTYVLTLVVPILTMRLVAEDKKNKTDQLILTAPVTVTAITLGKYFAALFVYLVTLVATFVFPIILAIFGNPSLWGVVNGYLGMFLMGAAFIAIGMFISSLTENQLTAAIVTIVVLLMLTALDALISLVKVPFLTTILEWISVYKRFSDFTIGIFSLVPIIYYISFSAVFVFLTIRIIEKRRWSER